MALRTAWFVCTDCHASCDCTSSHRDLGVCRTCSAPMIWSYGWGQSSLTAWCSCRPWKKGRLARSQEELIRFPAPEEPPTCPVCKGKMELTETPGTRVLEPVLCSRPFRIRWGLIIVSVLVAALFGWCVYYAW